MRIAIVGSHGTGKTTLAKLLSENLSINYIPDPVREAHEKKFTINENTSLETQIWILAKQLELERNTNVPWVSDKSLFDNLVYGSFSGFGEEALRVIRSIVLTNARYDLIFYLPIEFSIPEDGLRSLNEDFQRKVDKEFRKLFLENNLDYTVIRGSVRNRLNEALKRISSIDAKK